MMNRKGILSLLVLMFSIGSFAEDVAVFPVIGVNADRSYIDAFGMLLARKYETVSGLTVFDPIKSGRAVGQDSNYTAAAEKLGVSEYIELTAIGLYMSRKEYYEPMRGDSTKGNVVVVVKNQFRGDDDDDDDDDMSDSDQRLLDNNKTVVTAIRRDRSGNIIHKAELTLVTYGDLEEASDRLATALFQRITTDEARSLTNITRREGMGHNKLFAEKVSGLKVGAYYPVVLEGSLASFTTLGYNMRMESRKFFVEFGANARIPSAIADESKRKYGGFALEVGASYIFNDGPFGLYAGGGVIPHFNFVTMFDTDGSTLGLAPYLQAGITFPRNSRTRFYVDVRIAQNALPIATNVDRYDYNTYTDIEGTGKIHHPLEVGMNIGIGW